MIEIFMTVILILLLGLTFYDFKSEMPEIKVM